MKRLAVLLVLAGCGGSGELAVPAVDAGADHVEASVELDATVDGASMAETAIAVDAGAEVGAREAAREATIPPGPEPEPFDAGADVAVDDVSPPELDAGPATVCDGRAPTRPIDCTAQSATCAAVRAAIARVAAQFPQPCNCDTPPKCAGVVNDTVTETLPVTCRNDRWTLAGSQSGDSWVPWWECSRGCPSGQLCEP